ncbi:MAG: sugar phosphate isomerase/epimerase family protein [Actinomycetota bacterium]
MTAPLEGPSIQCSTGPFWAFDLATAFDAVAAAGFSELELMVTRDATTQEAEVPGRLAAERGLRIASVHAPFLTLTRGVWGMDPIGKIERGAEMCNRLGASALVVHPPLLWERAYARWLAEGSADFVLRTGVSVAVETMYPIWVGRRALQAYRWVQPSQLLAAADAVVMDTSHLAVARHDVLDAYELLAPKLVQVHLSNNAGDGRDGHLELGAGVVPVERLLDRLRRDRFDGGVCLELSLRRYLERPAELVEALRRNREYVEDRLNRIPRRKEASS